MGLKKNCYKQTIKKKYIFAASKQALDQWCNGSTPGFGSVSLGSNPGWSTLQYALTTTQWEFFLEESKRGVLNPFFYTRIYILT